MNPVIQWGGALLALLVMFGLCYARKFFEQRSYQSAMEGIAFVGLMMLFVSLPSIGHTLANWAAPIGLWLGISGAVAAAPATVFCSPKNAE
jgi:hypothetical protein